MPKPVDKNSNQIPSQVPKQISAVHKMHIANAPTTKPTKTEYLKWYNARQAVIDTQWRKD